MENYYLFFLWKFKNVSTLLVDAKSTFHQGSIICADSSVLVSFEAEAVTDENAAKKVFWGQRANLPFYCVGSDTFKEH